MPIGLAVFLFLHDDKKSINGLFGKHLQVSNGRRYFEE